MKNKTKEQKKITKKTLISELMNVPPKKLEKVYLILMTAGLGCVGCSAAAFETIEQGCQAHGMSEKEIDNIVSKLNKAIKD
ncbi:MAG TPA: DUF1858 domain-containing protein [Candidatus Paceibacterota bacterium]|nr:DUF1858 domain-containing protein [Candidatus Paceibacterota bacterium]